MNLTKFSERENQCWFPIRRREILIGNMKIFFKYENIFYKLVRKLKQNNILLSFVSFFLQPVVLIYFMPSNAYKCQGL